MTKKYKFKVNDIVRAHPEFCPPTPVICRIIAIPDKRRIICPECYVIKELEEDAPLAWFDEELLEKIGEGMKWISTENKLPEPFVDVLILIDFKDDFKIMDVAAYDEEYKCWRSAPGPELYELENVTHWMPLPLLPEE